MVGFLKGIEPQFRNHQGRFIFKNLPAALAQLRFQRMTDVPFDEHPVAPLFTGKESISLLNDLIERQRDAEHGNIVETGARRILSVECNSVPKEMPRIRMAARLRRARLGHGLVSQATKQRRGHALV